MLRILHTNDFHGTLTPELAAKLRNLKEEDKALYFDTGDAIKAGNLAVPLRREAAWGLLAEAGCDASVMGNRESHPMTAAFAKKLEGAAQPILVANMHAKEGATAPPALSMGDKGRRVFEIDGMRVGVFGVMVAMVTAKMATQAASSYLWDAPIPVALKVSAELRKTCDVVIALTHIGYANDRKLAEAGTDIDIILGGHSHTVLETPVQVGRTWIAQGGSHGRFAGRYGWDGETLSGELISLRAS